MADLISRPNRADGNTTGGRLAPDANNDRDGINNVHNRATNLRDDVDELLADVADIKGRLGTAETRPMEEGPPGEKGEKGDTGAAGAVSEIQNEAGQDLTAGTLRFTGEGVKLTKEADLLKIRIDGGGGSGGVGGAFRATVVTYDGNTATGTATYDGETLPYINRTDYILTADDICLAVFDADADEPSLVLLRLEERNGVANPVGGSAKEAVPGIGFPIEVRPGGTNNKSSGVVMSPDKTRLVWSTTNQNGAADKTYRIADEEQFIEQFDAYGDPRMVLLNDGLVLHNHYTAGWQRIRQGQAPEQVTILRSNATSFTPSLSTNTGAQWVDSDGTVWFMLGSAALDTGTTYFRLCSYNRDAATPQATIRANDRGLWEALGTTAALANSNTTYPRATWAYTTTNYVYVAVQTAASSYKLICRRRDGSTNWAEINNSIDWCNINAAAFHSVYGDNLMRTVRRSIVDGALSVNTFGYEEITPTGTLTLRADMTPTTFLGKGEVDVNATNQNIRNRCVRLNNKRVAIVTFVREDQDTPVGGSATSFRPTVWLINEISATEFDRQRIFTTAPLRTHAGDEFAAFSSFMSGARPGPNGSATMFMPVWAVRSVATTSNYVALYKIVVPSGGPA